MRALSRTCCSRSVGARSFVSGRPSVAASRFGRTGRRSRSRIRAARPAATAEEAVEISHLLDPTAPAVMGADEILTVLPHRYPFLLVDRVTHVKASETIVGMKNVTFNDNFFPGHFPNRPIMPGVLQVEALAQLTGLLILKDMDDSARNNFLFAGIDNCRFKKPVVPGDTLMMKVDVKKLNMRFGVIKVHGESFVNGESACEADLTLVVAT